MRYMSLLAVLLVTLGCGGHGNKSSIDRQARALNAELQAEATQNARIVEINGQAFRVAVVEGGSYRTVATDTSFSEFVLQRSSEPYALVNTSGPVGQGYQADDVEAAARAVSGCTATFDAGVLAFLAGDLANADLAALANQISDFKGWRTDLAC